MPLVRSYSHSQRRRQPMGSSVTPPNPDKTMNFAFKVVGDLAAAMSGPLMYIGDRLGLFRAIADIHQRSEEHTSELQSRLHLVCRLLLEKKKTKDMELR